jgi:hypothetical protein
MLRPYIVSEGARLGRRPLQRQEEQEEPESTVRSDCATATKLEMSEQMEKAPLRGPFFLR